jgi:hypothetical protein
MGIRFTGPIADPLANFWVQWAGKKKRAKENEPVERLRPATLSIINNYRDIILVYSNC